MSGLIILYYLCVYVNFYASVSLTVFYCNIFNPCGSMQGWSIHYYYFYLYNSIVLTKLIIYLEVGAVQLESCIAGQTNKQVTCKQSHLIRREKKKLAMHILMFLTSDSGKLCASGELMHFSSGHHLCIMLKVTRGVLRWHFSLWENIKGRHYI